MREQIQFLFRAAALIFLWRGSWHLLDIYLFPDDPVLSNGISVILGIVLLLVADVLLVRKPTKVLDPKDCEDCAPQG